MKVREPRWLGNPPVHIISHSPHVSCKPDQFELGHYIKRTVSSPIKSVLPDLPGVPRQSSNDEQ